MNQINVRPKSSLFNRLLVPFSALSAAMVSLSSCNVFSPFDKPGSDAQYLSAARACFDNGDFACAREYYGKLSSAYSDTVAEEESFITLDEQGASMAAYMEFVGNMADKGTGYALTQFANRLTNGAGATRRVAIWNVYSAVANGSIQNTDLKNFVTFVATTALAAEILAESAVNARVTTSTFTTTPSTCLSAGVCAASASCDNPSSSNLVKGSTTISASTSPSNTQAQTGQLYSAISLSMNALQAMSASGKFGSAVNSFNTVVNTVTTLGGVGNLATVAGDRCFRQELLSLDIGTN